MKTLDRSIETLTNECNSSENILYLNTKSKAGSEKIAVCSHYIDSNNVLKAVRFSITSDATI